MNQPADKASFDEGAMGRLLAELRAPVLNYVRRRGAAPGEAEDIVQEVMVRMLRRWRAGPVDNPEGYLFQIASNLLIERGRSNAVRGRASALNLDPSLLEGAEVPGPERILEGREAVQRLVEALQELPERTRIVFVLNRFEDMTAAEISRRLGMPVSTVEKTMMRALKYLKARL